MKELDKILALKSTPVTERYDGNPLQGLTSIVKVFAADGSPAFLTNSKLDLDTDSMADPTIRYESTHQNQTSIDPNGVWYNSNKLNGIVIPGGMSDRHAGTLGMGTLATVVYNGHVAHCVVFDVGPHAKFGEGSIALHRALGFERVKNNRIIDVGIDRGVTTLIYIGSNIGKKPFIQADIDKACAPLWAKFTS